MNTGSLEFRCEVLTKCNVKRSEGKGVRVCHGFNHPSYKKITNTEGDVKQKK